MDRLLSPNEAKFWLMDRAAPMNTVVIVQTRRRLDMATLAGGAFALPAVVLGRHDRPRWSERAAAVEPGTLDVLDGDAMSWLAVAADLLARPVGGAGQPAWRAAVIRHDGGSTLAFAASHALTDWRSGLRVAEAFLDGRHPGPLEPACEELLPSEAFGDPDAAELIDGWWSAKAGARWETAGLDRLAGVMPAASPARLDCVRLSAGDTAALLARCKAEGATPNGALAAALRDVSDVRRLSFAVDMSRFIRPAPPPGPGLAVSHLFIDLEEPGAVGFWEAARRARAAMAGQLAAGIAGDALLILPKVLLRGDLELTGGRAELTVTAAPVHAQANSGDPDTVMRLVLSSARGGGDVVQLSGCGGCLQLVSVCPTLRPDSPSVPDLTAIAERLRAAARGETTMRGWGG